MIKDEGLEDFTNFCREIIVFSGEVLITRDLNVQLDHQNCLNTLELCKILQFYSLQHVSEVIHTKGHCLDIILESDSNLIKKSRSVIWASVISSCQKDGVS